MKYTIRILVLLGIFIGSVYFFGSNMDEAMFGTIKTAQMTEAELPTIELKSDGVTVNKLYGYEVEAKDLRGGAALIIAALSAEGKSFVAPLFPIFRGYENIVKDLQELGAMIRIISEKD